MRESVGVKYGERFLVVQTSNRVLLLPVPADPVKDLEELGRTIPRQAFRGLKPRILERAKQEAGL